MMRDNYTVTESRYYNVQLIPKTWSLDNLPLYPILWR